MIIDNGYATIEENDVGVSPITAFGDKWPVNGWAGEITKRDIGQRVAVTASVFSEQPAWKPKEDTRD